MTINSIDVGECKGTLIVVIDIGIILELCLVSSVSVLKRQPIVSSAKSKELAGSVDGAALTCTLDRDSVVVRTDLI